VTSFQPTPTLTEDQRAMALKKATAVRTARRVFKDAIARGDYGLAAAIALAKANEALAGIRVIDLLTSLPGIGEKKAEAIMTETEIASSRRIRGLGRHQVALLVERVER
jgi:hypothetical protein